MANSGYTPSEIEAKLISKWETDGVYKTPSEVKDKSYVLGMFPYPSGDGLHTGHGRIFTAVDVVARYQRMKGKDVLMPVGWDAFGLPAENAAIKAKTNPMSMVPKNEANFKRQMQMLGLSFDWDRAFSTTDPEYYKWTQWIFLKLYGKKNGKGERLIYRKEVPINWCPKCLTGLANEEVQADGTHERCGTVVTQRMLPQWVMRITDYSDRLLDSLIQLDWPKGILEMQKNWIGKKDGINITYKVDGSDETITCFTTTPVNFGLSFLVLAPEHPILKTNLIPDPNKKSIEEYVKAAMSKTEQSRLAGEKDKTGVFTGLYVTNHLNGEKVPVWVSDFALMSVGTGAVQGCPGHDMRDFEFAKKFGIPIKRVVVDENGDTSEIVEARQVIEKGTKGKMVNSDFLNGMFFAEAMEKTKSYFVEKGWGEKVSNYHLRDWIFSRQRYWGEPIPLVYCSKCGDENGVVTVPEDQLPLKLPHLDSYEPTDDGRSPLSRVDEFVKTTCPKCGGEATRETDTMPNWAGSCWYFLRFADPKNTKEAWSKEEIAKWLPVDWYLGGAEHAVLHLLYARFWVKVLFDLGYLPFEEPFLRLRSVGMVLASDGKKMSKSLGNVINPDDVVAKFGADSVRIYEMFMGPWDQVNAWDERSLIGCRRFLDKVWGLISGQRSAISGQSDGRLVSELERLIEKAGKDIEEFKFNTAIAAMMKFSNSWKESEKGLSDQDIRRFLLILAPFAPFMSEELYQRSAISDQRSVHKELWPSSAKASEGHAYVEDVSIVVQVNGKVRGVVRVKGDPEKAALEDEKIRKWVTGEYKIVSVPGRLINFVLK